MSYRKMNRYRAELLEICLADKEYYEIGIDMEASITDVLYQVPHLCDKYRLDFNVLNDRGQWHYDINLDRTQHDEGLWRLCKLDAKELSNNLNNLTAARVKTARVRRPG